MTHFQERLDGDRWFKEHHLMDNINRAEQWNNSMRPLVSICATAAKPEYWKEIYDSIGASAIPFEFVFVGPNPPVHEVPKNFRYIHSDVKPTQCFELAWRSATGQFILHVADDLTFLHPNPLEHLYQTWLAAKNEKTVVSCRYMVDQLDQSNKPAGIDYWTGNPLDDHYCHVFRVHDYTSPTMPVGAFLKKDLLVEVGGVDRRFVGVSYDLDIMMRIHAAGGQVILDDEVYIQEVTTKGVDRLSAGQGWWSHDRILLDKLWPKIDGWKTLQRTSKFKGFTTDSLILQESNLIRYTQGKRGRWHGPNPRWESFVNGFYSRFSPEYPLLAPIINLMKIPFSPWRWPGIFRRRVLGRVE